MSIGNLHLEIEVGIYRMTEYFYHSNQQPNLMKIDLSWEDFRVYLLYKAHRKPETLSVSQGVFERIQRYFTDKALTEENVYAFFDYLRGRGDKNSTINNYIKYLHHIARIKKIQWLLDLRYLPIDERLFDTLTADEIRKIILTHPKRYRKHEHINLRYDLIIETLLATGLRRQELCNLTWKDIRPGMLIVRSPKGKQDRVAKISDDLYERIKKLPKYEYIFGSEKGKLIAQKINQELQIRGRLMGSDKTITAHTLRRTAATEAASKGVNLAYIQRFLGHKSIQTTSKYIQVDEAALQAVSRSLTVNEGSINLEDVYKRLHQVAQEFAPNFKIELVRTARGVRLRIEG